MKILLLSHRFYPDIGGIEANSEMLADGFVKEGHTVRMLTWTKEIGDQKFPYTINRNPDLLTLIKAHAWADVVLENNPCMRLAWPGVFLPRPSVIVLNTWLPGGKGMMHKFRQYWLKRARHIIAVSTAVKHRCWHSAIVIRNPYNAERFLRHTTIKKSGDFVFVGRLVSDKGAALAVKALHLLAKKAGEKNQTISLTIIGDGPEKENLLSMVSEFGLQSSVRFTGSLRGQALSNELNRHRFILVPSVWEEPFGNVVLEGLACGCLPIASDGGGLPDAVGKTGMLFERGNLDALKECMSSALQGSLNKEEETVVADHLKLHHPYNVTRQYLAVLQNAVTKN